MRKEAETTSRYKKDPEDEHFLEKFNEILSSYQEKDYKDLPETYPTLHIIGAPRSGTTLLSQLISSHLEIGYINNLIATFWRAPTYGIRLSKKLMPQGCPSSYQSDFGRTATIFEPHEFGYFWFSFLRYQEMLQQDEEFENRIPWDRLRLVLNNMTHAFGRPIVFKTFLLGWHIARMQKELPKTCFIRIRRDPTQNAISLLDLRQKVLGSKEKWASMKPREYHWLKEEPYWKQVAGQVYYSEKSMTDQINQVNGRNVYEIFYEELCQNPKKVLDGTIEMLARNGSPINYVSQPPSCFEIDNSHEVSKEDCEKIEKAVQEFFPN